jgi:hypothetical protein
MRGPLAQHCQGFVCDCVMQSWSCHSAIKSMSGEGCVKTVGLVGGSTSLANRMLVNNSLA